MKSEGLWLRCYSDLWPSPDVGITGLHGRLYYGIPSFWRWHGHASLEQTGFGSMYTVLESTFVYIAISSLSQVWRTTISLQCSECIVWFGFPQRCLVNDCLEEIEKPHHKTDCFLRVSSTIRARCHQDHMPEDERIHGSRPISRSLVHDIQPQHL